MFFYETAVPTESFVLIILTRYSHCNYSTVIDLLYGWLYEDFRDSCRILPYAHRTGTVQSLPRSLSPQILQVLHRVSRHAAALTCPSIHTVLIAAVQSVSWGAALDDCLLPPAARLSKNIVKK